MPYKEITGNIFNSNAMAIVNTVNCIGVMGKGIALEYKLRFPAMFEEYQKICGRHLLRPGQILPYKKNNPWILNFAIKDDWHQPSKVEWIEETLRKFKENYRIMGITSVAFPWMGAMNGGIPIEIIKELTRKYLQNLDDITVEVYDFDKNKSDPLFETLNLILSQPYLDLKLIAKESDIHLRYWKNIASVMTNQKISSLYNLINAEIDDKKIVGKTNVEKLYNYLSFYKVKHNHQTISLF